MDDKLILLEAFADARRSWDDLIAMQPDAYAGGGNLEGLDLAELTRRVETHQECIDVLVEVLQTAVAGRRRRGAPNGSGDRSQMGGPQM
jgi:hypothetical protein